MRIEIDDSDALPLIQNLSVLSDSACRSLCSAIKAGLKNDSEAPGLRSRKEIQAAHDALRQAIQEEGESSFPQYEETADDYGRLCALRALCWVLGHDSDKDACFSDDGGALENLIQCAETLNEMAKDDQEEDGADE